MAELLQGWKRTHYCAEPTVDEVGKEMVLMGWAGTWRNLGSLIFIGLRDRTGTMQVTFNESELPKEVFEKAETIRSEYVIAVKGVLARRDEKMVNRNMQTGELELIAKELKILGVSETPPFYIDDNVNAAEQLRLKYRYLDLRRPCMQANLLMRSKITRIAHEYFAEQGFIEIETPTLCKSTPEGARDYLVPSRVQPGKFYALPQSPQIFKQLLMLSGFDRYMQIARCYRDEDLRADRQPEFTQIDLEMSFVEQDDVMNVQEGFIKRLMKETLDVDIQLPLPRITWQEAMDRYGSDKPDTRFGLEFVNVSDIVKDCGFGVFAEPVKAGGSVRLINVNGHAKDFPRKKIDKLGEFVKTYKAKGLAWARMLDGKVTSSYQKFLTDEENAAILERAGAKDGDLILIVGDVKDEVVFASLGALRIECAKQLGILDPNDFKFLWVTEFPMFEWSEEEGRYQAMHHPFTAPMLEDEDKMLTDKAGCRARAYDIVLNGTELGGGSIRINTPEMQTKAFEALGISDEDIQERFGHLVNAFQYGAPPHGGLAYGLDRLVMLMTGASSIRDVIAFPKVQNASDLMMNCPDVVDDKQLDDLSIAVTRMEETPAEDEA